MRDNAQFDAAARSRAANKLSTLGLDSYPLWVVRCDLETKTWVSSCWSPKVDARKSFHKRVKQNATESAVIFIYTPTAVPLLGPFPACRRKSDIYNEQRESGVKLVFTTSAAYGASTNSHKLSAELWRTWRLSFLQGTVDHWQMLDNAAGQEAFNVAAGHFIGVLARSRQYYKKVLSQSAKSISDFMHIFCNKSVPL